MSEFERNLVRKRWTESLPRWPARSCSWDRRSMPELQSTLTCPECAVRTAERMPTDACQYFYACPACGAVLKPLKGDCCVFCSYGDLPCPPIQEARATDAEGCCSPP